MIPSMDAHGGWSGFLRSEPATSLEPKTLGELGKGTQVFPETSRFDYAAFLRNDKGEDLGPLVAHPTKCTSTVALVGGGIANVIAAYELSRCGVKVTLFDNTDSVRGRFRTLGKNLAPGELGAARVPVESRMIWHYVRQSARWCYKDDHDKDADTFTAEPYPNPAEVPTQLCYQNRWRDAFEGEAPQAVWQAAMHWQGFLNGLNDGATEPLTLYLEDIQKLARAGRPASNDNRIADFWKVMRERYEHKSLGEVLRTEVFAGRGAEVTSLMHVFATLGAGSAGFGHLFEVGFLEILRNVIWDTSGDYIVPGSDRYAKLGLGMAGFVGKLAEMALEASSVFFPGRTYADMYRTALIDKVTYKGDKVVLGHRGQSAEFDFAIIGVSTRAMQALGLDRDRPQSPFSTSVPSTTRGLYVVQGVQAAIHQLNMVPATKASFLIRPPETLDDWPTNHEGQLVRCFITDRYPHVTSMLQTTDLRQARSRAMVTAYGDDALKYQSLGDGKLREALSSAFGRPADIPIPQEVVTRELNDADGAYLSWSDEPGVNGGFKLDRPGDTYLTGCLFFHYQTAAMWNQPRIEPYTRVFFSGDSVSFLGGWAEGAAMSALNATTAVLEQVARNDKLPPWELRTIKLLDDETDMHEWTSVSTDGRPWPQLVGQTMWADCSGRPMKPGKWGIEDGGVLERRLDAIAFSQSGRQMLGCGDRGLYHRSWSGLSETWGPLRLVPGSESVQTRNLSIDSQMNWSGRREGKLYLAAVDVTQEDSQLLFGETDDQGNWTPLTPLYEPFGKKIKPRRCSVAAPGADQNSGPSVLYTQYLESGSLVTFHLRRTSLGIWLLRNLSGPYNNVMYAFEVASAMSHDGTAMTIAVTDVDNRVQLCQYLTDQDDYTPWQIVGSPFPNRKGWAGSIAVAGSATPGRGHLLVQAFDGNLYYRPFDLRNPAQDKVGWTQVPYPVMEVGGTEIRGMGLGAKTPVKWLGVDGSVTVWATRRG